MRSFTYASGEHNILVEGSRFGAIDSEVDGAIDNAQVVVLAAELLKERLEKAQLSDSLQLYEYLDFIISKTTENADVLYYIRRTLQEEM